jgi:hypothetical protein
MASNDELMQALRAADAAGDTPAATAIARRLASQRAQPSQAVDDIKDYGALDFAKDVGKGGVAALANIGQTLLKPAGWVSPTVKSYLERSKGISDEMREEAGMPGMLGGLAVDIAGTAGVGGLVSKGLVKGASYLPTATRTARALTSAPAIAAGEGAISGAYLSPDDPLKGAAFGSAGGVAGQQILSRTLGRIAKPIDLEKFADTDAIMKQGVPMTVGLGANPNTVTGRGLRMLEETLSAAPVVGGPIKGQRELAKQAWRDVPLRDVAKAAGVPAPSRAGYATHEQLQEKVIEDIGKRYEGLLTGKALRPTGLLKRNLDDIVQDPKLSMVADDRKRARSLIEAHIYGRQVDYSATPPRTPPRVQAADIFKAQSDLRKLGNKAMQSDLSSENAFGKALVNASDEIYAFIQRRFPTMGKELQDLRRPYAELATLRAAAEKAAPRGEFSPTQLGKIAAKRGDEGARTWASIAEPLLTKDPGMLSNLARLSLLTGSGILMGTGALPVAAAASLLFGTRTGQKALQGLTAPQKRLAALLASKGATVGRAGGVLGREAGLGAANVNYQQEED